MVHHTVPILDMANTDNPVVGKAGIVTAQWYQGAEVKEHVMSLQGHTARHECKVSVRSRVQWFNGAVVQMRSRQPSREVERNQWIARVRQRQSWGLLQILS